MPSVVVAVAGAVASSVVGGGILGSLAGLAVSTVLTSAFGLDKKPKTPSFSIESHDRTHVVRSSIANRYIVYGETIMSGPLVFAASTSGNEYIHLVIPLAGHPCEEIGSVYFGDVEIQSSQIDGNGDVIGGEFNGYARIKKHLGATDQAADSDLVSEVTEWTSAHRLLGITYIYVRLKYSAEKYHSGIPNIKAVVKGKNDIYDPRSDTSGWTDNWALCLSDFLQSYIGADASEVNTASVIAAANISDEVVDIPESQTQARYTCNGAIDTGNNPAKIREELESAGAGACTYSQGQYHIFAGAYRSPISQTFNEDDLRGDITVQPRVARRDLFNAVRGTYLSAGNFWQATDFPAVTNTAYETQDGEQIYRDVQLPFTNDTYAAQRIAKIYLEKSRQGISVKFPTTIKALQVAPFDTIQLSIDHLGWSNKIFRVTKSTISPDGGIDLDLQEESSSSYDWNEGEATVVDAAPDTALPDPFSVGVVSNLSFSEDVYDLYGVAILSWDAPVDSLVREYRVQYKKTSASVYTSAPKTEDTTKKIYDLAAGDYNFRVASVNSIGQSSDWVAVNGTISIAPVFSRVSGLELFGLGNSTEFTGQDAKFTWRHSSEYYAYEIGAEEYGADSGGVDNYFRDYEVRIFNGAGTHLRTEHVIDNAYTYTFEKNKEDGGPYREIKIEVYQRGRQGQLSALPATITVSNPAPVAPSGLSVTAAFKAFIVEYDQPDDTDFQGTLIWASESSGFTPGAGNLVYSNFGSTAVVSDLETGATLYIRVASFDKFGTTEVNMSTELSVTPTAAQTDDLADLIINSAKIANEIESNTYVAGSAGWKIDKNGDIEANDASFRGEVIASYMHSLDDKFIIDLDEKYLYIE